MTKRLVLIDGMSVFYRGYFAMPGLSLPDGTPTGGVFGFASIAIEVIKKLEPDYIAVAWDISKTSTAKRKAIYPEYKAGRTRPPDDFFAQIPLLHELLEAFGWPLIELDQYEADDIIGTVATQAAKEGIETCIVTGDYDMMQLLNGHVNVYITRKGSELIRFDEAAFMEKYGVHTRQFMDYKALVGDTSDNIPGVRGVGPKAAQQLLGDYDTLDGVYEHLDDLKGALKTKLETSKDSAYLSRQLVEIFCDAPVALDWERADIDNTDLADVARVLKEFQFSSLVKRLPKHMQQAPESGALHFEASHLAPLTEQPWPETLQLDGPAVLHVENGVAWLSSSVGTVSQRAIDAVDSSVWRALEFGEVIAYDVKQLYHTLDSHGILVRFDTVHDIHHAAFLIDPLRRDRSLATLVGESINTPAQAVAALRNVYAWQKDALSRLPAVATIARDYDFPLIYPLFQVEKRGIKIRPDFFATMSEELAREHAELEQAIYQVVGAEFNIGSPAQLSEILFTKLQLPTTGVKRGKTGYSTDQKTLDKLRGQHPIVELIERTRELAKLKNTYVDTLPTQADAHDRIHTTYEQDVAATGRLSSNHPNLQNIPVRTELGRRIREGFVPEDGKVFVSADYSQFELRLAAVLAGDDELINDFNGDVDVHTKTAAQVQGIPMDSVTKAQRRAAKVINFGVLYGMSPHGLAAAASMSFADAKKFIDHYFELRAPIRRYIDDTLARARTDGYVATYYGRRRPTPDIHSSNFMVRSGAERAAANMPIQGTEADLMKRAMIQVEEQLGDLGQQILQIHDSILVECPKENAEKVSALLKDIMEAIAPELAIKLKVDVSTGYNWGEL